MVLPGAVTTTPARPAPASALKGPGVLRRTLMHAAERPVLASVALALCARLAVGTIVLGLHHGTLFGDDPTYFGMAAQAASGHTSTWNSYTHWLYLHTATYMYPLTLVFKVFGASKAAAISYTGLLATCAVALT